VKKLITALLFFVASMHAMEEVKSNALNSKWFEALDRECDQLLNNLTNKNQSVMNRYAAFSISLWQGYKRELIFTENIRKVFKALRYATIQHSKVVTYTPKEALACFIYHPLTIAINLMNTGEVYDPNIIISALLLDKREGTVVNLREIKDNFGTEIERSVREVIGDKRLTFEQRRQIQVDSACNRGKTTSILLLAEQQYSCEQTHINPPPFWSERTKIQYYKSTQHIVNNLFHTNDQLKAKLMNDIAYYLQEAQWNQHLDA